MRRRQQSLQRRRRLRRRGVGPWRVLYVDEDEQGGQRGDGRARQRVGAPLCLRRRRNRPVNGHLPREHDLCQPGGVQRPDHPPPRHVRDARTSPARRRDLGREREERRRRGADADAGDDSRGEEGYLGRRHRRPETARRRHRQGPPQRRRPLPRAVGDDAADDAAGEHAAVDAAGNGRLPPPVRDAAEEVPRREHLDGLGRVRQSEAAQRGEEAPALQRGLRRLGGVRRRRGAAAEEVGLVVGLVITRRLKRRSRQRALALVRGRAALRRLLRHRPADTLVDR
mmetsp:Transcript_25051/g.85835  ORF Transcript_25051/g.85835 Transcript_25051/m.85835 type:complete len:283 (-) Transcript_25051:13-861(-)